MDSTNAADPLETRLRTMRVIWAVLLNSVFLYAVVGAVIRPPAFDMSDFRARGEVTTASVVTEVVVYLIGMTSAILLPQLVSRAFNRRAEREQRPDVVQTGFVIAVALAEVGALSGLVLLLLGGSWFRAFMLILTGALSVALLYPRRDPLAAATYRKQ